MESDGVVFIDGSLIEDGALKDRTRVGGLTRRNDVKRVAADSNLSRPLCQGPVDRRLAQPPLQLTAPKDPAPRLRRLGL